MKSNKETIKKVFAGELWKSTMIKNMLEENGVQAFLENEYSGSIAPFQVTLGGVNPVNVVVSSENYEKALKFIEEFNNGNIDENNQK